MSYTLRKGMMIGFGDKLRVAYLFDREGKEIFKWPSARFDFPLLSRDDVGRLYDFIRSCGASMHSRESKMDEEMLARLSKLAGVPIFQVHFIASCN